MGTPVVLNYKRPRDLQRSSGIRPHLRGAISFHVRRCIMSPSCDQKKQIESCCWSFTRVRPANVLHDLIDLIASRSVEHFLSPILLLRTCSSLRARQLRIHCTQCGVVSPFFSHGFPFFSAHWEFQCGPLQMTHFRSGLVRGRLRCSCCWFK